MIQVYFKGIVVFFLFLFLPWSVLRASEEENRPVLLISSYNPEIPTTARNISEFFAEYRRLGGKESSVVIENMNCKSFSEMQEWRGRMADILAKFTGPRRPLAIVLLGQEAWTSYLSQDRYLENDVPLICGMVSRNAVLLPHDTVNMKNWIPESVDAVRQASTLSSVHGRFYNYDVRKNIELILDFYPETKHIAFLSDNSYGGVSLQALVRKEMGAFPGLDLILLDGRLNDMQGIIKQLTGLPEKTALLIGTWRVDANDSYFMRNATYALMVNPQLPTFSLSSLGLDYWAIAGYIPEYNSSGKQIAADVMSVITRVDDKESDIGLFNSVYTFNYEKLKELGFSNKSLPAGAVIINKEESLYQKYKLEITVVSVIFAILVVALLISLLLFYRTKRLKSALEDSEASNQLILRNIKENIKFITPDYTIIWHNSVLIHGSEPKKGQKCYETLYGLSAPCENCTVCQSIETHKSTEFNVEYASNRYKHVFVNPVYNASKQLLGLVVRSEDVTRQKMAEIELLQAKEKAEESDRLKTAFLANMSHEIRTPLNAIVGFSNLLVEESCGLEERKQFGEIIVKNSDLLLCLINDILDISRLETGRISFSYQKYDLIALGHQVLATASHLKKEGVEFVFNSPYETYDVVTDAQRLQQILINLVANASKFTESGTITLEMKEDRENDRLLISVTDTGCGVPVELQERVFERFEKLNEYVQGTGLGLAICKLTINKMGGDIWIDKEYARGARFVFSHPLNLEETR